MKMFLRKTAIVAAVVFLFKIFCERYPDRAAFAMRYCVVDEEIKKKIAELLTTEQALRQTAEEAAELAQAALKLIRVYEHTTPVTEERGFSDLVEEIADVNCCINVLCEKFPFIRRRVQDMEEQKNARWLVRLGAKK